MVYICGCSPNAFVWVAFGMYQSVAFAPIRVRRGCCWATRSESLRGRCGRVLGAFGSRHSLTLDAHALRANIPDLPERDVLICGPEPFTKMVAREARRAGVAPGRLHIEGFGA